eukprot:602246_1
MDTDRIGTLIQLMRVIDTFDATQYSKWIHNVTQTLSIEFTKQLIFYGFYSLFTLHKDTSDTNINALRHVIEIALRQSDANTYNPIAVRDAMTIQNKLTAFNTVSLQQLASHRHITFTHNAENNSKLQLLNKIKCHLSDYHAVKSVKYHKLSLKQLQIECSLFNTAYDPNSISNTLQCLLHQISKTYPINMTYLPTSILCFICTYLDIRSLLRFECSNRIICINARKPQSIRYGLRHHQYQKYIQFHYNTSNKKYNILPDLYRFSLSNNLFIAPTETTTVTTYRNTMKQKLQTLCRSRINHLYVSCIGKEQDIVHLPTLRNIRLTDMGSIKYTTLCMDNLLRKMKWRITNCMMMMCMELISAKLRMVHFEVNMHSVWFDECEAFVDCISRQLFVHESLHWIEIEMKDRASDIVNVYDVFHKTFKVRDCMGRKGKLVLKIKVLVTDDQFNANIEAHASHIGQLFNSLKRCYKHCMLLLKFEFNMYRLLILSGQIPDYCTFFNLIGDSVDGIYHYNHFEDVNNHEMSLSLALSTKDCNVNGYHANWMCQCDKCYSDSWFNECSS